MALLHGLLPSQTLLDAWGSVTDAASWAGVDEGVKRSVMRQLGDTNLDSLAVLAMVPTTTFEAALNSAVRGFRPLYETEKARLQLMYGAIRAKFGAAPQPAEAQTTSTAASSGNATGNTSTRIKIKLNQVIDQGCDRDRADTTHPATGSSQTLCDGRGRQSTGEGRDRRCSVVSLRSKGGL